MRRAPPREKVARPRAKTRWFTLTGSDPIDVSIRIRTRRLTGPELAGNPPGVLLLAGPRAWEGLEALRAAGCAIPCIVMSVEFSACRWALEPVRWLPRPTDDAVRAAAAEFTTTPPERIRIGDTVFDAVGRTLVRNTTRVDLTPVEVALLEYLVGCAPERATEPGLLKAVWPNSDRAGRAARMVISRLRKKCLDAGIPSPIWTHRGYGLAREDVLQRAITQAVQSRVPVVGRDSDGAALWRFLIEGGRPATASLHDLPPEDIEAVVAEIESREPARVLIETPEKGEHDLSAPTLWWCSTGTGVQLPAIREAHHDESGGLFSGIEGIFDDDDIAGYASRSDIRRALERAEIERAGPWMRSRTFGEASAGWRAHWCRVVETRLQAVLRYGSTPALWRLRRGCARSARHLQNADSRGRTAHTLVLLLVGEMLGIGHWVTGLADRLGTTSGPLSDAAWLHACRVEPESRARATLETPDARARLAALRGEPSTFDDPDLRAIVLADEPGTRRVLAERDRALGATVESLLSDNRVPLAVHALEVRARLAARLDDPREARRHLDRHAHLSRTIARPSWENDAALCWG